MQTKERKEDAFCREVKAYLLDHAMLEQGDRVLVGLSAGADSVALLLFLRYVKEELGICITALTVHHGIRGASADEDLIFAARLCDALQIPWKAVYVDVPALVAEKGYSTEEAGRILRYAAYEEQGRWLDCNVLALAHHKDDQCETVLHHLIRGSSLRGIAGMAPVREQGSMKLIRPFLCVGKGEIEAWLVNQNQDWRLDESNLETVYTRNYIRHELMPELVSRGNLQARNHIVQAAEDIREAQLFLEAEADKWLHAHASVLREEVHCRIKLPVAGLMGCAPVLAREILIQGIRILGHGDLPQNLGRVHLQQLMDLCKAENGRWIRIPGNLYGRLSYGMLWLEDDSEREDRRACIGSDKSVLDKSEGAAGRIGDRTILTLSEEIQICVEDNSLLQGLSFEVRPWNGEKMWLNPYTKCMECGTMNSVLFLRTRQPGDFFILENGGRKSLRKYMIDQKIPVEERDQIPVLADGHHVWWIGDGRICADKKVCADSRQVLILRDERIG